jgi:hypothetical protein
LAAVGDKFLLMMPAERNAAAACLYACLGSFALDYAARQKVGGTSLKYYIVKQLPALEPAVYLADLKWEPGVALRDWIVPRVVELTYTAWDLEPFARDVGYNAPPFRWDPTRRTLLRAELDAAFFHLYGLSRDDTDYVMDTFPIVRKNDEKAHGEYRTKRLILEIYDAMAQAASTGVAYETRLDPPAAAHDPRILHAPRATTIPSIPSVAPAMAPEHEAAVVVWAILHANGGPMARTDLARAFVLRGRPELLEGFAPAALIQTVRGWREKVGQRALIPGLLAATLRVLDDRRGVELTTGPSMRSVAALGSSAPSGEEIDPWYRFEAALALQVLRSQPEAALGTIDNALAGDDRDMVGYAS